MVRKPAGAGPPEKLAADNRPKTPPTQGPTGSGPVAAGQAAGSATVTVDTVMRVVGIVAAVWAAVLLAFVGALLTPVRLGGTLLPVALVAAVGGNLALVWYMKRVVGGRFLALLPGLVWLGVAFWTSGATGEGDVLLAGNNWVAAAYLLVGSATVGILGYRLIMPPA